MHDNAVGVVEVRVRRAEDGEGLPFTTWPLDDLDRLISLFNRWGNPTEGSAAGQFTYEDGRWFFELIVDTDDD